MVITRVLAAVLLLASGTAASCGTAHEAAAMPPAVHANACQLPRSGAYAYDCAYNQNPMACGGLNGSTIRWTNAGSHVAPASPLAQVLDPYNLFAGRVWVLFLLWITLAPWLFLRFRSAG